MKSPLSKKEVMREIVRCGKDPNYFINNYAKITHPMHGLIPFKTYSFQKDALKNFEDHRFNIVLKARQLGLSTVTAAYIVWMMLFHREKNVLVLATKFGTAANLVKKVKSILKSCPEWIKIAKVSVDNRTSFELTNGSQIKASSTSGDAGRSEALSLLVIDEAAHVEGLAELWTGLYPTLSTGGRCIALSTPNGVGNWFHKTFVNSSNGLNDFYPMTLPWQVHPDRDQEWFEKETKNMSRRQIAQELECNFNMSGETVFHPEQMQVIYENVKDPKHKTGFDRNYWIWKEYSPEIPYLLSADVARGDGRDYSVFHVFDTLNMEIVAEYQGKVAPDIFSGIIRSAASEYGDCMVVVENNTVGFSVLTKLKDMGCPNIYHSIKSTHEYVDEVTAESVSNSVPGFTTTQRTRPLIVAKLEEFVRNGLIKINSSRLYSEMKTFVWNNGRPEAMRSYNDDLIMACAIGCWVRETALIDNKKNIEYNKAFLATMVSTNTKINTTIKGMQGYEGKDMFDKKRAHAETYNKYPWLYKG
tara:strand:- start:21796 stop:23382 length:1587 start_codon:yes stop_codon:yes gene_type:complete